MMADSTIGFCFDQRRACSAASPLHRVACRLVDCDHIIAIDGNSGNAVCRGAGRDVRIG